MMKAFTRNYEDNSTEAGFQFTFYCDICNDGYKTSFVESETHKKNSKIRSLGQGVWAVSNLLGGRLSNMGWAMERGTDVLAQRFDGMSAEWQKEHEQAFINAQNEAQRHFHRCHGCHRWVCESDYNEAADLCVECSPLENVAVTKARAAAMRTPLNAVLGFTDLALREGNTEKKQQYLQKVKSSGALLLDLVNDTLELSRIESGKLVLEPEAVSGTEIWDSVGTSLQAAAAEKNIKLLADRPTVINRTIWADRLKLQKVLLNLISNAIKYTPAGGTVHEILSLYP